MKFIVTLCLGILISIKGYAKCGNCGLIVYPSADSISQNSLFMLEGILESQKIIHALNKDYPIYLESEGNKIPLKVVEVNTGLYGKSQAILKPYKLLEKGKYYELQIDNLDERERKFFNKYPYDNKISWVVKDIECKETPVFVKQPSFIDSEFVQFGCGPAVHANFRVQTKGESLLLYKTEFVSLETRIKTTFYLMGDKSGTLKVGHGMCNGAFNFKKEGKYKVRFSLLDFSGNENKTWTDWVIFDSPFLSLE
ncbi:hypothetical protein [Aestuariibaculum marinum]|uniref:Uncharacterized protein n=1 Tax=Aestuariibaculum marinum TaxID=2683592 RepID=A0A8J6U3D2_9FLAO|nr:hypothetical protein [Aestuariibaculum marinum]MBD0823017.1 hypothetical protein [Aestuariibaculum marinum]